MSRPNIILTGFMGSGKTTVGTMLARQLQYIFIDTDHLIEERCGMTVQELFRTKGEDVFRAMETEVAKELGAGEGMVISTGGRLMLDPVNAKALSANGRVFCLVATPEEIMRRISADTTSKRPLLENDDPMERIVDLMNQRKDGYGQFSQIITNSRTPGEVVEMLLGILKSNSGL